MGDGTWDSGKQTESKDIYEVVLKMINHRLDLRIGKRKGTRILMPSFISGVD